MMIAITPVYSLHVEDLGQRVRLVIYKNGTEYICRRESRKTVENYLRQGEGPLFKGRLKFHKSANAVDIIALDQTIGTLSANVMQKLLAVA